MESISRKQFNRFIEKFQFDLLFNQLGWNAMDETFPKKAAGQTFEFRRIAEKHGFVVLVCSGCNNGEIPDAQTRKIIHTEIAKLHHEHLIIFHNTNLTTQHWQMLVRETNKPVRIVSHKYIAGQHPELLYHKLSGAFFTMDEDENGNLTISDVVQRMKENFGANAEKITKKFYADFKKQHTLFLAFISGIEDAIPDKDNTNKQWYASLMLNRLMFCYFIQRKGFLDLDKNYLQNKLRACKELDGSSNFYSFYKSFLLELFHDGLGKPSSSRKNNTPVELGRIPYLNGGLFDVHELEHQFNQIEIDDDAFDKIFNFFDQWEWYLDTREHAEGRTINPDVIGYIFEKYINDRASMGAYYTKEDITDYIGRNTIIPWLFDEVERHYKTPFQTGSELWEFLKNSGDTYIYDALKHGVPKEGGLFDDLPQEIKDGFQSDLEQEIVKADNTPHLWEIRKPWNQKAPAEIALPTEIYRELLERRKRYAEVLTKIKSGEIKSINDFITYNLNIRQFTQDFLETTTDTNFIRHFYKALQSITILDPTSGSGAFLFASMNILEPLYEVCIRRMEEFTDEQPGKHKFFEDTLAQVFTPAHPNLQYFIYKTIILNNLYGVDIMKEAVEIAKLRLFLKLVACVDVDTKKDNFGLEPLPDIDFNIRAGNTLVGFANEAELLKTIETKEGFFAQEKLDEFKEEMELVSKAFKHFQNSQLINDQGSADFRQSKVELTNRLKALNRKLHIYMASNYGIDANAKPKAFNAWLNSHQPFHWFAEFYQIIAANGGFGVIVGNPPYLEMRQVKYDITNLITRESNAIHSMCIERSNAILSLNGAMSMIVPLALVCTQRMTIVQNIIEKNRATWYSNFSWRPAKLFDQVNRALTIFSTVKCEKQIAYSTGYQKWNAEHRVHLFPRITYSEYSSKRDSFWFPKISHILDISILKKVLESKATLAKHIGQSKNRIYYRTTGGLYWKVFTDFPPKFYYDGNEGSSSRETSFSLIGKNINTQVVGLLSSNLFWWWYTLTANLRDLNPTDINDFHFPERLFPTGSLLPLCSELIKDLKKNSVMLNREQKGKGLTITQSFKISKSKPIIDQIDTVLAEHYGFTEEELDFIINYDIKYRMGKELFGEGDNEGEGD